MNNYIKDEIFKDNLKLYTELENLSNEIAKIKITNKPYLIEFLGSARSGKTTSINLIADVLKKHNLKVNIIDEEKVNLTKAINNNHQAKMDINSLDYTNNIIDEKIKFYDDYCHDEADIVIFDRGINDEFIWLNTFGAQKEVLDNYNVKLANKKVDILIILTCDAKTSLERKYFNSLSIIPNKWTNPETLNAYLKSLDFVSSYFNKHAKLIFKIDSTNRNKIDVALTICNKIIKNLNNK